ncbi:unnamed protein product [Acanthoscelides obtectus]|uniref:Uncharacterized protein n=1 Tax=Acanthoscelides obtectus TaxID=200917 RepID=A0A9P0NZK8_ACAOB|nr:unnamed protein product [Acanthoscelides obtectus]CAK1639073.1 hypothetical protein AOBTE_LOCUS10981 [Acanthoscelides obtectus]
MVGGTMVRMRMFAQDVKNKYTHSILTLRRQSDVLTQTHAEMQMEIVALKADKANLWNDLAAATAKECTYLRQIEELKKKHDQKMKTLKNNYERLLLEQNGHVEETIWRTATVLGHKVEQLAASNKNYLGIIEALKDKLKLQEQYKLAVEIKKTSLNHKVNTLLENINDLHIKLLKERKSAGNYLLLYKQMAAENTALRNQIQEKNSVLIVLRDQIHSSKVELDKQKQSFKNQTVAGKNAEVKALTLQNDLRMKITLLDQLRAQKHRIIKKNKALINECITLTEKLQGTNVELKQLKTEFDQLKTEMEQQKNKTCEYCGL